MIWIFYQNDNPARVAAHLYNWKAEIAGSIPYIASAALCSWWKEAETGVVLRVILP